MEHTSSDPTAEGPTNGKVNGVRATDRLALVPSCPACGREMRCEDEAGSAAHRREPPPQPGGHRYYCGQCNAWLVAAPLNEAAASGLDKLVPGDD